VLASLLAGLGLGFSLIVAIGAQNLFVLRQGIRREHVLAVVAVCTLSDLALIALGVSGIGLVLHGVPWLAIVVRVAGALFLIGYGLLAARRALRPAGETLAVTGPATDAATSASSGTLTGTRRRAVVGTALALTWLNPHVYLDTVFLLGSVASSQGDGRWWFALGAGVASVVWFAALGYGARLLAPVLATPRAWRVLDALIAVVMVTLGVVLAVGG
jgi:L-lysine exporter family protein LysE/ArgO